MENVELTGTIVPLVTPFAVDESFDPQAMARLIEYVIEQGADALMPTALTGEGPLLEVEETKAVWSTLFEKTAGRLPIIPTVISTTTQKAIKLVRIAEKLGAVAVMVAPILPELYAGRSYDDVYFFYMDVADAMSLPIILFNYPSLTGVDFVPPLVARLVEIDNVRYIKESTGDVKRVHSLQRMLGERLSVICGAPNLALESLSLGCRAWITGIMNAVPRSAQQLMCAVLELGNLSLARRIYYRQILPLVDVMVRNNNPIGTIKGGVNARGVDVGVPRRPGGSVGKADQIHLKRLMSDITQAEITVAAEMASR